MSKTQRVGLTQADVASVLTQKEIETFWRRIRRRTNDKGCWLSVPHDNYGTYSAHGVTFPAHRLAYVLSFGDVPDSKLVCHHCDVKACANPKHLFLGTAADNTKDWWQKNGVRLRQKNRKLTAVGTRLFDEDIDEIKRIADERGTAWQIELRLLVRRALRGEKREIPMLSEVTRG